MKHQSFRNTSESYRGAVYGEGTGRIWLDGVNCEGSEIHIDDCDHKLWGLHECYHSADVAINCFPNGEICLG